MFNVPTNFYDLRENQKMELKIQTFNNVAGNENISATWAMKKYLGLKDRDILANREFLRKDAELRWELMQIESNGPNWKEAILAQAEAGEMGAEGDMGGGFPMGGGGGGGLPPEFGGEPAAVGGAEGADLEAPPGAEAPQANTQEPLG